MEHTISIDEQLSSSKKRLKKTWLILTLFNLLYFVFIDSDNFYQSTSNNFIQKNGPLHIGLLIFLVVVPILSLIIATFINLIPYKTTNRNQRFSRSFFISLILVNLFFTTSTLVIIYKKNVGEYNNNQKDILNER
jgi:hypothetical protein